MMADAAAARAGDTSSARGVGGPGKGAGVRGADWGRAGQAHGCWGSRCSALGLRGRWQRRGAGRGSSGRGRGRSCCRGLQRLRPSLCAGTAASAGSDQTLHWLGHSKRSTPHRRLSRTSSASGSSPSSSSPSSTSITGILCVRHAPQRTSAMYVLQAAGKQRAKRSHEMTLRACSLQ